jgi:uncharacterized protein with von Willebrand factor type A (vWA) domain
VTPIVGFIAAVRDAGVRVSPAESIEALRALEAVGYGDRAVVRDALGLVLAKSVEEKRLFEVCFERYFGVAPESGVTADGNADDGGEACGEGAASDSGGREGAPSLGGMLLGGDGGGIATAIELAAAEAGLERVRYPTQRNMTVQRIMERLGEDALLRTIATLRAQGESERETAGRLERERNALRERVRARVDRRIALAAPANERRRDEILAATPLRALDRGDLERMRAVARAMAKRLALRFGRVRKRRRRGVLDLRRTLRGSMAFGGVPFAPAWKRRRLKRSRVMVLCDVSGSVATVAQFLLLVVYGLTEALAQIRAFAFVGRLVEVSAIFERERIEDAIPHVLREAGYGSSDYGGSLADFVRGWLDQIDRRTAIVILGDARSNFGDPRVDLLAMLHDRAGRVIWLNPEHRSSWGTGDSEMLRYLPYCDVARVCANLNDLEAAVAALMLPRR